MNYFELLKQFWQTRRSKRITSIQADLYYYLVEECNVRGWENPFEVSNKIICASIGITEPTLIDARNRLQQYGLIEFQGGKKNVQSPVYYLKSSLKGNLNDLSRNRATSLVTSLVETELTGEPLIRQDKTRLKEEEPPLSPKGELFPDEDNETKEVPPATKKKKKAEVLDKSFIPTAYLALVEDWIAYRKSIGKPYRTQFGLTQFFKKLVEISGDNLAKAKQIVEHAKGKEWQDVYPINQEKKQSAQRAGQILEPKDETHKSDLLKRFNNGNTSSN